LRVMLVTGSFPPDRCGVGDYTARLASALVAQPGVEVSVLTGRDWTGKSGRQADGVAVMPALPGWRLRHWRRAWKAVRAWRPDVVHLQNPTQGYRGGLLPSLIPLLGKLAGARIVRTWHEPLGWGSLRRPAEIMQFLLQAVVPGKFVTVRPNFPDMIHPLFKVIPWPRRYHFIPNASSIPAAGLSQGERDALRSTLLHGQERLIVFFGFIYPGKGVDQLFEIAAPATDHLLLVGEAPEGSEFAQAIRKTASRAPWSGKVTILGHQPEDDVARLLAAADAVVLPFVEGGGPWNTSLLAARMQKAVIVSTSLTQQGWQAEQNIYWAKPGDTVQMRRALANYASLPASAGLNPVPDWSDVVTAHLALYGGGPAHTLPIAGAPGG